MTRDSTNRDIFPKIELSDDQQLWLETAYDKFLTGEPLNTEEVRVILWDRIPEDFDWRKIDQRLLQNGSVITLLGILHVAPRSDFADIVDRIIKHIRALIRDNPKISDVTAENLSKALSIEARQIEKSFRLMSDLGDFWSGALGGDRMGHKSIRVAGENIKKAYLSYKGLDKLLTKFYDDRDPHRQAQLVRRYRTLDYSAFADDMQRSFEEDGSLQLKSDDVRQPTDIRHSERNEVACPRCYQTLRLTARFCDNCGLSLTSELASTLAMDSVLLPIPVAQTDSLIGRILEDKYQILEEIGKGAMGRVYRARHLRIGHDVVVKVLRKQFVADETALLRFRREAQAAAQIHHANVVVIHDFGEGDGLDVPAFIVMELLRGNSLKALIAAEMRIGFGPCGCSDPRNM